MTIGIDIGGTKIEAALIEGEKIVNRIHVATAKDSESALLDQLTSLIKELKGNKVGIGIAGQIDKGTLLFAPNLNMKNIPLAASLEERTGLKVTLANDVRAAGFAEWKIGSAKNCDDFICIFLGTGIGGMIVTQNRIVSGHQGLAGEIGHITIDYQGLPCTCGSIGCLETLASGWGLAKRASLPQAFTLFDDKNSPLLKEAFQALVLGIKGLVNCFNPEKIIIGGGLKNGYEKAFPDFLPVLESEVKKQTLPALSNVSFHSAKLGSLAGVYGAAFIADS